MNHIQIIGRLTADPELNTTHSGKTLATFSLAVNNKGKDAGTTFFSCVAWGVVGETIARYCRKGQRLAIGGSMQSRSYESNGKKGTVWELIVSEFDFIEAKTDSPAETKAPEPAFTEVAPPEDLPF